MTYENQTVLITGASSGIGAAIAKRFAAAGYELLLLGRDERKLAQVKSECKNLKTETLAFDLANFRNHQAELEKKLTELAPVSVVINCAGVFHQSTFEENTDDIWLHQFQVNFFSAVQLVQFLWPTLKKYRKGSIVNIASTLGIKPTAHTMAYSAAKAAMINWTLSLAQDGGFHNIRANCVCPGIVDTPIHQFHFMDPEQKKESTNQILKMQLLQELGKPEDIAEAAFFLGSDLSRWTTGSTLNVDGGIHIK